MEIIFRPGLIAINPGAAWVSPDVEPLIASGGEGYFSFTTGVWAIGHVGAMAGEADVAYLTENPMLGPSGVIQASLAPTPNSWPTNWPDYQPVSSDDPVEIASNKIFYGDRFSVPKNDNSLLMRNGLAASLSGVR
jgi:hypothetical protein